MILSKSYTVNGIDYDLYQSNVKFMKRF